MEEPKLGNTVNIHANDKQGTVVGIWETRNGKEYQIQYGDSDGVVHEIWLDVDVFTITENK